MEQVKVEEVINLRQQSKNKPKEKKQPCTTCKKKKKEIKPEPIIEMPYIPDMDDVKLAYEELTSYGGVKEDKKEFISKVYKEIFNEELVYDCQSCVSTQARKFKYFITNTLKINV